MYVNLWEETNLALEAHGLTWDDVKMVWIEREDLWGRKEPERFKLPKARFEELAKDMEYDNGFGGAEVCEGLHIRGYNKVGTPFVMFRNEYDGSEWWELHFLYTDLPIGDVANLSNSPDYFEEDE